MATKLSVKEKKAIIKALKEGGISLTGKETNAKLIELAQALPKDGALGAEVSGGEAALNSPAPKDPAEIPTPKQAGDSVDILKRGNIYTRTYSKDVHGKDFLELAESFVNNPNHALREYSIVPSSTITSLAVRYREKEDFDKPLDKQKPDSPIIEKEKTFGEDEKEEAIAFANLKKVTVSVSKRPAKK